MSTPVEMEIPRGPLPLPVAQATPTNPSSPSSNHDNNDNIYNPSAFYEKSSERPVWSSRAAFGTTLLGVLMSQFWRGAAVVARTNVWASILAFVMSFSVIGLPLLLLEVGLGQRYQVGGIGMWQLPQLAAKRASSRRPGRFTGLGVASLAVGLASAATSAGILGWTANAWVDSFSVHQDVATNDYWIETIVGQTYDNKEDGTPLEIEVSWNNVGYLFMIWIGTGTLASLGARKMGHICLWLTTVSTVLLLAIAVASIFCTDNKKRGPPEVDVWTDFQNAIDQGDVLSEAIVQTLYMLGLFVGIQSAYASYGPPRGEPTAKLACAAVGVNLLALVGVGYCVSVALENTASLHSYNWHELGNSFWTDSLLVVWVQWPAALSTLPMGIHWIRLLYIVLLVLGAQLPIAVVSAFLAVFKDDKSSGMPRWKIACLVSAVGLVASLPFATSAGLVFMDTLDYYLTLAVLLIGFLESFAAGWCYNLDEQIHHFGHLPIIFYVQWNFLPVIIAAAVWFGFDNTPEGSSMNDIDAYHYQRMWIGLFGGIVVFLLFFALCFVSVRRSYEAYLRRVCQRGGSDSAEPPMLHPRDYYLEFCFGNVEALKRNLEPSLGQKLPQVWYIFLKRVIPHLLLLVLCKRLLMVESRKDDAYAFGGYAGYPVQPYQQFGLVVFGLVVGLIVLGLVFPTAYAAIVPPPTSIFINRRDTMEDEDLEDGGTGDESISSAHSEAVVEVLPHMEDPQDIMDGIQRVDLN